MSAERPTGLTEAMVLARRPSGVWTPKRVAKLWRGRAELAPAEVAALAKDPDVDIRDLTWLLVEHVLDERRRRHLAADLAQWTRESAKDERPVCAEALWVVRAYADGEASADRLREALDAVGEATAAVPEHEIAWYVRVAVRNACCEPMAGWDGAIFMNLRCYGFVVLRTHDKGYQQPDFRYVRRRALAQALAYAEEKRDAD
jgi:hypothetical protein